MRVADIHFVYYATRFNEDRFVTEILYVRPIYIGHNNSSLTWNWISDEVPYGDDYYLTRTKLLRCIASSPYYNPPRHRISQTPLRFKRVISIKRLLKMIDKGFFAAR